MTTSSLAPSALTTPPPGRRPGDLAWFFGLTFAVTWGIAALLLVAGPQVEALTGEFGTSHPLYFLAVYAPTLTAVLLTAVRHGRPGLAELVHRVTKWRVHPGWWVLVLLGWPVADWLARLLQQGLTGEPMITDLLNGTPPTPLDQWYLAPALLLATLLLDPGPLGEEVGWRGFALPRMLGRLGALGPAVLLGLVWGVWHLPAFLLSGTAQHDQGMGFAWLVLGTTMTSVLMTWIYRHTGSVLVSGIAVHLMNNSTGADLWAFVLVMIPPSIAAGIALARGHGGGQISTLA